MEEKEQKNENIDKPKSPAANKFRKVNLKKEGSFRTLLQHLGIKKSFRNDIERKGYDKPIHSSPSSPKPGPSRKHFERNVSSSPNSPKASVKYTKKVTLTDSSQESPKVQHDAGVFRPPVYLERSKKLEEEEDAAKEISTDEVVDQYATEYKMDHKKRGHCYIFNHENFEKEDKRSGTEKDVEKIKETFSKILDFEVHIYDDLECTEILDVIKQISTKVDYSDCDCLAIFVLTHGKNKGDISAKDMYYPLEKLWQPFTANKCISLAGKPKLFFINACRGEKKDHGIKLFRKRNHVEADSAKRDGYKIPTHSDFLIAHSSFEDHYSFRNTDTGTWFIQALCDAFQEHHQTHDLLKILTITSRNVAVGLTTASDKAEDAELTQIPSFTSMLIRDVYFRPKPKENNT